ncbi:NACHT domain-containing protein [Actinocorallia longicatena]|uniref:NACHT domain-containing protein n=1 Tax=Actinocorallia longicatena TaxID=111803 RepID=A0ABP6QN56_9ACTN
MPKGTPANRLGPALLALAVIGPPVAAGASLWDALRAHPVQFVLGLVVYEIVVFVLAVTGTAFTRAQKSWGESLGTALDGAVRRGLSRYGRHYRRYLIQENTDLDLKGLSTVGQYALPLDTVFVDLGLAPRPAHEASDAVVSAAPPAATAERSTIWELLRAREPLAVIGAPGGGKSTLLRHVTLVLARGGRSARRIGAPRDRVPVLLQIRKVAPAIVGNPSISLPDVIRGSLQTSRGEPPRWFDRQLDGGRCVVMLDGLDEVATQADRRAVVDWVDRQIATHPRNVFVVTSRPYGYRGHPLRSATVVQVRPFTRQQIARFLATWYLASLRRSAGRTDESIERHAREDSDDLLSRLRGNPELLDLAANPLILTMIANVHRYRGALPGGRGDLYKEISEVLLVKRQEAKGMVVEMTISQKQSVLQRLAFRMMTDEVGELPLDDAADAIAGELLRVRPDADPYEFITEIEQGSGMLQEPESGVYAFAHLTFQEYLASVHLRERGEAAFLAGKVDRGWWRETTRLFASQADVSPIVRACIDAAEPRLTFAAELAREARQLDPSIRAELAGLLAPSGDTTTGRWRAAVTADLVRKAAEVVTVAEELAVLPAPVSVAAYRLFLQSPDGRDRHPDHWPADRRTATLAGEEEAAEPILGMRRQDAVEYARFAGSLLPGGWTYRLPRVDEARRIHAGLGLDLLTGLWCEDSHEPWGGKESAITAVLNGQNREGFPDTTEIEFGRVLHGFGVINQMDLDRLTEPPEVAVRLAALGRRLPSPEERGELRRTAAEQLLSAGTDTSVNQARWTTWTELCVWEERIAGALQPREAIVLVRE